MARHGIPEYPPARCDGVEAFREAKVIFPLPYVPSASYKGGNGFDASREKVRTGLKHAANDLAAPPGTPVLAMDFGTVINGPYSFFRGTFALEVKHPHFIARYCEIERQAEVKVGDTVKPGQVIAFVGNQPGDDMLHIEFFSGRLSGNLSYKPGTHPPYDRRDDVFDGTRYLDQSAGTAHHIEGVDNWRFVTDADGRKFLAPMDLRDI
jgi:murein DD-endopeptidase MepM/ murein hydrolase activator NlpD